MVRTALIFAHAAANEDAATRRDGQRPRPSNGNGAGATATARPRRTAPGADADGDDATWATDPTPLGQVVMVTSPGPDEGKTTTVSNLAAVLAEGGLSVLVINCDFRRPRIQKYLLEKGSTRDETDQLGLIAETGQVRAVATMVPRVRLVTGIGEGDLDANPIEIVAVQKRLIAFARLHYDIVLLDTAPFLTTNDASDLLVDTDSVIMVARCGKTRKEAARRAAELLFRLEAPLLGTVFTDSADAPSAEYYYHYYLDDTEPRPRSVRNLRPGSSARSDASRRPRCRDRPRAHGPDRGRRPDIGPATVVTRRPDALWRDTPSGVLVLGDGDDLICIEGAGRLLWLVLERRPPWPSCASCSQSRVTGPRIRATCPPVWRAGVQDLVDLGLVELS